jgi:phosphatidylglycerophosphate synthase
VAFWADYRKSLKPIEVEEPVDRWFHRPLGYVVARALLPTPISPNLVTLGSILVGVAAALLLVRAPAWSFQLSALCLFASAVLDCADGQLARLRDSSSDFGRMLDGVADAIVISAVVFATTWVVGARYAERPWLTALWVVMVVFTIFTSMNQTSMYDHYKNVYLRMTQAAHREGEGYNAAQLRRPGSQTRALYVRISAHIYVWYAARQERYVAAFDPHTCTRLSALPAYHPDNAAAYRRHALAPLRVWRGWFGFGSLVFGLAVSLALRVPEVYLLFRAVVLNAVFYAYLRPAQRRASRRAFAAIDAGASGAGALGLRVS